MSERKPCPLCSHYNPLENRFLRIVWRRAD